MHCVTEKHFWMNLLTGSSLVERYLGYEVRSLARALLERAQQKNLSEIEVTMAKIDIIKDKDFSVDFTQKSQEY